MSMPALDTRALPAASAVPFIEPPHTAGHVQPDGQATCTPLSLTWESAPDATCRSTATAPFGGVPGFTKTVPDWRVRSWSMVTPVVEPSWNAPVELKTRLFW